MGRGDPHHSISVGGVEWTLVDLRVPGVPLQWDLNVTRIIKLTTSMMWHLYFRIAHPQIPTACENWTLTAELERRIQALWMRCYRRLLNISYKNHVANEEVRNRIQNVIGVHDDLLTMVKKRKRRLYGHISRSCGMAKTILQRKVREAEEEMGR